jgi:adenine-specific DNA methylase
MKYMGSKRWMLKNGLGDLLAREIIGATRFVDLFAGSAVVSAHVATKYDVVVKACDLQTFSTVLARAVLCRQSKIDPESLWAGWYKRALHARNKLRPPSTQKVTRKIVGLHREWSAMQDGIVTRSYGGYYFGALQAVWLDALLETLPENDPEKSIALASLLGAASQCAAAPGHTAQPFQPTRTAKPFLAEAWRRSITRYCKNAVAEICLKHAKVIGDSEVADASVAAQFVEEGDLVFVDPPYSGVHYSRFYHVLETIARGRCNGVSGTGRYPAPEERPRSKFSLRGESSEALRELLENISLRRARAIVTFPQRLCSNGLSGTHVAQLAGQYFSVEKHWVASKFSTLGGDNHHRYARRSTRELILILRPKRLEACAETITHS